MYVNSRNRGFRYFLRVGAAVGNSSCSPRSQKIFLKKSSSTLHSWTAVVIHLPYLGENDVSRFCSSYYFTLSKGQFE